MAEKTRWLAIACFMFVQLSPAATMTSWAQTQTEIPASAWRADQQPVLSPAKPTDSSAPPKFDATQFRSTYLRKGRPAAVVLWNRVYSDKLQQDSGVRIILDEQLSTRLEVGVQRRTVLELRDAPQQAVLDRAAPRESVDLQMRAAFVQALLDAGLRLVDRNVVMRSAAMSAAPGQKPDAIRVESQSLARHADWLIEVLNTPDPSSPLGWATHVTVLRLADGQVLAQFYADGQSLNAEANTLRFEADPKGGFRERIYLALPAESARSAAQGLIARLTTVLGR